MSNQHVYVIVPVKATVSANGELMSLEQPALEDAQASLKVIGSVHSKDKVMGLLNKYGSMLKGFLK